MKLYKEASLMMLPTSVKDGKLYSIFPQDGDGDFTFSRGSNLAATRINEQGLIEKGRENLLLQSNQFDTTWTKYALSTPTSGQTGYDGTSDAWLISKPATAYAHLTQAITSISGVHTYSVYIKAGTNTSANIRALGSSDHRFGINLSNGTSLLETNLISYNIEDVGSGWYRCSISFNANAISNVYIYPENPISGTSAGNIYIQDAQLEQGLVATDYIESGATTGKAGVLEDLPRLDWSGECPVLLLEPQRTNLVEYSELFSEWTKQTITDNEITLVSNSLTGFDDAMELEDTSATSYARLTINTTTLASTNYTFSVFVKKTTGVQTSCPAFQLEVGHDYVVLNTTTGETKTDALDTGNTNYSNINVIDFSSEWWKLEITATTTGTTTRVAIYPAFTGTFGSLGNGNNTGNVTVYGAQVEEGSYATSYIPTRGQSATRAKDTASIDLISKGITTGLTSATLLIEYEKPYSGDNLDVFRMQGTSDNGRAYIYETGNGFAADWNISGGGHTLGENTKVVWRLDSLSSGTVFKNGVKANSGSGTAWSDIRYIYLNNRSTGGILKIKQIALFPTALSDNECINLTTI